MDNYYYDITTFNNWPVAIAVIAVAVALIAGSWQFSEVNIENERRIKRNFSNRLHGIVSIGFTVPFGVTFVMKTWREIIQPIMGESVIIGWVFLPFVVVGFAIMIYRIGKAAGLARLGTLVDKRQRVKRLAKKYNGALYEGEEEE